MIDSYPNFYDHSTPKARKAHICCECRGKISPGETYHYHSGSWEGDFATFKVCNECEALRSEINGRHTYEDGVAFGELGEHVHEYDGPDLLARFEANRERRRAVKQQEAK